MSLKRLFLSAAVIPMLMQPYAHAQDEIDYVVLKNPNFTDELKISIDPKQESFTLERCRLDLARNLYSCQKVGESLSFSQLEKVQDQLNSRANSMAGGAVLAAVTFFALTGFCFAKAKCAKAERFIFPGETGNEWGLFIASGAAVAGASLASYLSDTKATSVKAVLELKDAIEQSMERNDQESGALVVETQASLKEIVESFSLLQLLIKQNQI